MDREYKQTIKMNIENITAETVLESWRRTANPNEDDEVEMKAYKIIEYALEKQTSKDAQETQEDMEIEKICSTCDRVSGQRWRYCWWCGQKFGATIEVF